MKLTIDFETRSAVDLSKTGPYPYAEHPSTSVMCLAFKEDNQPPRIWLPEQRVMGVQHAIDEESHGGVDVGDVLPLVTSDQIRSLITRAEQIEAHNVQFELAIWHHVMRRKFGFPDLPMHKLRDTAAVAAMHALPRKLEQVCQVLRLTEQKDMEGHALMLKMSKPRAPRKDECKRLDEQFSGHPVYEGMKEAYAKASKEKLAAMCRYATRNWVDEVQDMLLWNEDPKDIVRLCQYCLQDVQTEYALSQQLGDLPPQELKVFQHDLVVNTRGVQVDLQMARSALQLVDTHNKRLLAEMDGLTSGLVKSPKQNQVSRDWLATRGVKLGDLKAETVKAALKGELPEEARRFLEIRQSLSKSSTAKYEAAINQTCSDGRLRGFAMYHGAGTGRWTGKGIQLQNLPRGVFDMGKPASEAACWNAVDLVKAGGYSRMVLEFGDPMPILSSVIRPLLVASPGCEMHAADFSAIEGRGLAWLAGEEWVLDAYRAYDRHEGPDMYIITASKILGIPVEQVTKAQRKSIGKPGDLGTGYGGNFNALAKFGAAVPHESRAEWIIEWIRRQINKPKPHYAAEGYEDEIKHEREIEKLVQGSFESYIATLGPEPKEEQLTPLRDQGWPYPTEAELFEIWGRDVVTKWRASRPKTVALWRGLEKAAIECVDTGLPCTYGPVTYRMEGMFCTCELPSGRKLYYPFPKIINREMPWGGSKLQFSHMTVDADTKQWIRRFAHGGLLTENCFTADTLVVTPEGAKSIVDILPGEFVWDGEGWVCTKGPVQRGERRVVEWLGVRVTPDHLITDGTSWKAVSTADEHFTQDALRWAQYSVTSPSFKRLSEKKTVLSVGASAEMKCGKQPEICTERKALCAEPAGMSMVVPQEQSRTGTKTLSETLVFSACGAIDTQAWYRGVLTRTTNHSPIMAGEEYACLSDGSTTEKSSLDTQRLFQGGTNSGLTSTESTTTGITAPEMSGSLRERSTPGTGEQTPLSSAMGKECLCLNSMSDTVPSGKASTAYTTTSKCVDAQRLSLRYTEKAEVVYDLLECGSNHRFTILTSEGPLVVHNCTQAVCRDLLAEALLRLEAAGFPIIMHVHDEAVAEVKAGARTLEEFEQIMTVVPAWAEGFPISAAGWVGNRYKKD